MDPYRIESTQDLILVSDGNALHRTSLYVPIDRAPPALHASELRVDAALEKAAAQWRERGMRASDVEDRLAGAKQLPDPASLDASTHTLVGLGDAEGWAWAPLVEPLPAFVRVGPHYALRPLIRALRRRQRFRLLAVSPNRIDVYTGDGRGLAPTSVDGLPSSLADALGHDVEATGLSFRAERPVPGQRANAPVYHGHGGADAERTLDRERFHRRIAQVLENAWAADSLPLLLAAEVRTAAEFRRHARLPGLLDAELRGNPDDASPDALHRRAWPIVEAALRERERALAGDYEKARNAGKTVDDGFEALALAAIGGRVRRLWVEEHARVPGRLDETTAKLAADGADEDALDALVTLVLRQRGDVHVVDEGATPSGAPCCAELR